MKPIACHHCSTVFTPTGSRNKTCSLMCRISMSSKRNAETGCIEWQMATVRGYGVMRVDRETILAHRLAYELSHGTVPPSFYVMHKCDNPRCVNVEHLMAGTPADNANDMTSKGRHWIKGKQLPQEYRERLKVPKKTYNRTPEQRSAIMRKGWETRRSRGH